MNRRTGCSVGWEFPASPISETWLCHKNPMSNHHLKNQFLGFWPEATYFGIQNAAGYQILEDEGKIEFAADTDDRKDTHLAPSAFCYELFVKIHVKGHEQILAINRLSLNTLKQESDIKKVR
jgi:hypothetical protein